MTSREAAQKLRQVLAHCSAEQARDVSDVLEIGAGVIAPEGAIFSGPVDVPSDRRHAFVSLIEAIYGIGIEADDPDRQWTPIHSGDWESVLATLVVEEDWETIAKTASSLRDEETEEHRELRRSLRLRLTR
jgi:hypothetical protein